MVHEQLPVIISTLIKDNMYLQEHCRAKKTLALDIFYTKVTIHTTENRKIITINNNTYK